MEPIDLLIVEDSAEDAELLVYQLRRAQFEPHWTRVETELDYLTHLRPELDLILSDFTMPQFNGMRALELLKNRGYEIPFIMVSGTMGEERAVNAIKQGAADYLMKDRTERLVASVNQAMERTRLRKSQTVAEQAVKEGERKFRTLFDAAHDAIYMLHNGVFIDCNIKGLHMYGRTWDQIVGHTPDEFATPLQPDGRNSREKAFEIVTRAMEGEAQRFEWTSLHSNGMPVCSEVSLNRVEMGGKIYLMAVSRDVTERRQIEEQVEEQAALLDKAQDAIAVRDLKGNILFWNKGAERIYGWRREEVIGKKITELIYQDPTQFEEANRLVKKNGEWSGEISHFTKDRRELTVEARWTLVPDKSGRPKAVLAINTDVTEKKKIEAQFMQSQRLESIGTLAGGIAHDLNNILTPILTSIEILKLTEVDPKSKRILETIETSSKRGASIVRQVLSFARGFKGERIEIQPKRLLKDIQTLIENTFPKNIKLSIYLSPNCWTILGDPTQLHQVLLNLSVNSRDAMPDGGHLAISLKNQMLDEHHAAAHPGAKAGRYVVLTVMDTGTGMVNSMLDKIFEPFYTTKEIGHGTGLGLSTVISVAKSHGGFVDVDSEPGMGTTFQVYFPAMKATSTKIDENATLAKFPRGNGETILIVDDEAAIRDVTSDTLENFGYRTLVAHDGAEAVSIYEQKQDQIAVILTDMTMPVMDGFAEIRALLKINPSLKIIASSGFNASPGVNKESVAGSKYFLAKPYTAEALLKAVRTTLDNADEDSRVSLKAV